MFVFMYVNTQGVISIIQETSLEKINKKIRKAVQTSDMYSEIMDEGQWEIYHILEGELFPYTEYSFMHVPQFL